jgi:hypothetical protein
MIQKFSVKVSSRWTSRKLWGRRVHPCGTGPGNELGSQLSCDGDHGKMKGEELGGDLEIVQYHRPKGEAGSGESIKRFGENWEIAGNRDNGRRKRTPE